MVSVNPIRDTLFASNPDLYYLIGNTLTISASLLLTGGMAANAAVSAGTSIGRAVVTEYAKQGLTMAASSYVEKSMTEATNSPLAGFVVGSLTGMATYGTLSEAELEVINNLKRPQQLGNVGESGKYSILSYEDAENIAFDAIHGPNNADAVVLGKYGDGGPTAYTSVAKDMDAQYFQLDNWDELAVRYSEDELWKINEKFLDIQTSSGREIYLSHNPEEYLGKEQFYSRELQYLLDNGYKFVDEGGIWHAVR